jgi:hypothetical protein
LTSFEDGFFLVAGKDTGIITGNVTGMCIMTQELGGVNKF